MISRLSLIFIWLLMSLSTSVSYAASSATKNLWLCPDPSGVANVVSATSAPSASCKPYSIAQLRQQGNGNAQSVPSSTPPTNPSYTAVKANKTILPHHSVITPTFHQAKLNHATVRVKHSTTGSNINIYLCTTGGKQQIVEGQTPPDAQHCQNMGAKQTPSVETIPLTHDITHQAAHPKRVTVLRTNQHFYFCRSKRKESIIKGEKTPKPGCLLMNVISKSRGASAILLIPNGKKNKDGKQAKTVIMTTTSEPGDIYKCYDAEGRPTFVNEREISGYRRCQFFSRSFASVQNSLRNPSTQPSPKVSADKLGGPQLLCSGAGIVVYDGETHTFSCATRSYDYSTGSTGGDISSDGQYAHIPGHNLDYFNTKGNCGGTITSENGRVLHLEPTKDCPAAFKIEARRIADAVRAGLNIEINGAFLERQRGLSAQINRIAQEIGVDPYLVHAVISAESAYKARAVSRTGARGLMQLMPATARRFGVVDSFHSGQNIRGGATYLKWLLNTFNGNMELAIAGYNAGEGNVIRYGYTIPPFIETKAYVPKVMQYYRRYRNNPSLIGL